MELFAIKMNFAIHSNVPSKLEHPRAVDSYQGGRGQYCACKRGAVGPPGAPGETGPRGWRGEPGSRGQKGEEGSFDFLLAIVKDLRTDIDQLKAKLGGRQGGSLDPRRFGGQG